MSDTLRVSNLHLGMNASNYNQPHIGYTSVGIGSTANYGFLQFFGTSNTLCWTANGTVGIGKMNPAATLDVNGTVSTNGTLTLNNSTFVKNATTSGYNLIIEGGSSVGSPYTSFYAAGVRRGYIGNATTTTMELVAENGTSLNFYTSAAHRMAITTDGLFGIGNGTTFSNSRMNVVATGTGTSGDWIAGSFGGTGANPRVVIGTLNGVATIGGHNSTLTAWADLILQPIGNVGIGVTVPTACLHIKNSTSAMRITGTLTNLSTRPSLTPEPASFEIRGSSSGGDIYDDGFLRLSAGGGTTIDQQSYIDLSGYSQNEEMDKNIRFGTYGVERMRITRTGNLGIRTTGPVGLLSVLLDGGGAIGPAAWSSSYALFGPGANSTTGSSVGITYNATGEYGVLLSITPNVAWRDMYFSAGTQYFYVRGSLAGYVQASGFVSVSDEREKINIKNINTERSLQRILSCTPKTFQRIMDRADPMIPDEVKNKWHIGLNAQEVLSINPHCISEWTNQDGEARYGINYTDFVIHLIGSVQELSKKITSQDELIQAQEAKMATLHGTCASLQARLDALEALVATSS